MDYVYGLMCVISLLFFRPGKPLSDEEMNAIYERHMGIAMSLNEDEINVGLSQRDNASERGWQEDRADSETARQKSARLLNMYAEMDEAVREWQAAEPYTDMEAAAGMKMAHLWKMIRKMMRE